MIENELNQSNIVCAIYRESISRCECIGTGTFVIINDLPFLITAKHVLKGLDKEKGLILLIKHIAMYKLYKCQIYFNKIFDFAYIPLTFDFAKKSSKYIFFYNSFAMKNVFLEKSFDEHTDDILTTFGYPHSKNKIFNNKIMKTRLFILNSKNMTLEHKEFLISKNFNPIVYSVLEFDEKNTYDDYGNKIIPSKTESISGGAIINNRDRRLITNKDNSTYKLQYASSHRLDKEWCFSLDSIITDRVYNPNIIIGLKYVIIETYIEEKYTYDNYKNIVFKYDEIDIVDNN